MTETSIPLRYGGIFCDYLGELFPYFNTHFKRLALLLALGLGVLLL